MKYQIMMGILFTLLAKKRMSAGELASRYDCSPRSIYRYVEELIVAGVPIDVARGAGGGIYIADSYKLPKGFFTREEYDKARAALLAMHEQTGDPILESALEKLTAQMKSEKLDTAISGNILVDSGTWGDERRFSEKLTLLDRAISEQAVLSIDYVDREGERSKRDIEPHLLVYKQSLWYLYAYCRTREAFRLFKVGRMRAITVKGELFERRPFTREEIPLFFRQTEEEMISAKFAVSREALPFAEEWLGVDNVYSEEGNFYAEVTLPDDEALVGKILSAGAGFTVLAPESLRRRVREEAMKIAAGSATASEE